MEPTLVGGTDIVGEERVREYGGRCDGRTAGGLAVRAQGDAVVARLVG
ncbi:MAG: hypothetical protein LBK59_09510 [Bifidobacteriaceae bacterium]|jgi:hypothetical protein|nr:hypothetical protein [Bifidobacteriaceae bacterium]